MQSNRRNPYSRRHERTVGRMVLLGAALCAVALIVVLAVRGGRHTPPPDGQPPSSPPSQPGVVLADAKQPTDSPAPLQGSVLAVLQASGQAPAAGLPPASTEPGIMLPVVSHVDVDGMQVAITVDDCFQLENVNEIAQIAIDNGAHLTFFPVGRPLKRDPGTWKRLHDLGFEIECHTYHHTNLLKLDEDRIRQELTMANQILNDDLGLKYTYHFLRTPGGSARLDPRVHAIMADLGGFQFMAHWRQSGTGMTGKQMANTILPGDIVLYHSTNTDLKKLREFIPLAVQQGFQLVTLNELMGLSPNETAPLDDASSGT